MRRVQKAAAVLAALALTTALAVPVWAENSKNITGSTTVSDSTEISVAGSYDLVKTYNVDIAWTAMNNFTYTAGSWQGEAGGSLQYKNPKGWNNNTGETSTTPRNKITVVNRSNANIAVKFDFTASGVSNQSRIKGRFVDVATASGNDYKELNQIWMQRADANLIGTTNGTSAGYQVDASTLQNVKGKPVNAAVYFSLVGRPADAITDDIGKITVTVSAIENETDSLTKPTLSNGTYGAAYTQEGVYVNDSATQATAITEENMKLDYAT